MSDENKKIGTQNGDDTSALFVSARKKQLAQQEDERKRADEEYKRLQAEAEVRKMEEDVRTRKLAAEQEGKRITAESGKADVQAKAHKVAEPKAQDDTTQNILEKGKQVANAMAGPAKKIGRKIYLVIAAIAVVFVVIVIISMIADGAKGGKEAQLYAVTGADYYAMSATDQEAYVVKVINYFMDDNNLVAQLDNMEQATSELGKQTIETMSSFALSDTDHPIYKLSGGPIWFMSAYFIGGPELFQTDWLENVNAKEWTEEQALAMQLNAFETETPDDVLSALIVMGNMYDKKNAYAQPPQSVVYSMWDLYDTISDTVKSKNIAAGKEGGMITLFGSASSADKRVIFEMTGIDLEAGLLPTANDALDGSAVINSVGITVNYPTSSMELAEQQDDSRLIFDSVVEGAAQISIIFTDQGSVDSNVRIALVAEHGEAAFNNTLALYPNAKVISSGIINETVYRYEGLASLVSEEDGRTYYIFIRTTSWEEDSWDGIGIVYHLVVICREDQYEACRDLALRMKDSQHIA